LAALTTELDQTYRAVAARLPNNPAIRFKTVGNQQELVLSPLDKLEEPASLVALREAVVARLPAIDLPEILLEISARTGFTDAFTHLTERTARAQDLTTSRCAVLLAEACNTGPEPLIRHDVPALRRERLAWVNQNYLRDDTLVAANARLVAAQNRVALAHAWGGGEVASADGMRFVVPVHTVHAGPNPKYFGFGRGVTWYNLLSDQCSGLNAITVPGTLRDSLILLAVVLEQQTELHPTKIMTDTGAYSDVVFGLFRLLGYRFSPRLANVGGTRFWRIDADADYGALNVIARQRVSLGRIEAHWDDFLRLAGSLKLGRVPATGIMRTLQVGDRPTQLALALAEGGLLSEVQPNIEVAPREEAVNEGLPSPHAGNAVEAGDTVGYWPAADRYRPVFGPPSQHALARAPTQRPAIALRCPARAGLGRRSAHARLVADAHRRVALDSGGRQAAPGLEPATDRRLPARDSRRGRQPRADLPARHRRSCPWRNASRALGPPAATPPPDQRPRATPPHSQPPAHRSTPDMRRRSVAAG